jgi:hypothetical protein
MAKSIGSSLASSMIAKAIWPRHGPDLASHSEWEWVAEDTRAGQATGEGADEVDGVDLDAFAVDPLAELAAGGPLEHEVERLAVDGGPLGDMSATRRPSWSAVRFIGRSMAMWMSMRCVVRQV